MINTSEPYCIDEEWRNLAFRMPSLKNSLTLETIKNWFYKNEYDIFPDVTFIDIEALASMLNDIVPVTEDIGLIHDIFTTVIDWTLMNHMIRQMGHSSCRNKTIKFAQDARAVKKAIQVLKLHGFGQYPKGFISSCSGEELLGTLNNCAFDIEHGNILHQALEYRKPISKEVLKKDLEQIFYKYDFLMSDVNKFIDKYIRAIKAP